MNTRRPPFGNTPQTDRGTDGKPLDRVVIEDAWAVFRLQQEGVLALGALNPFIDDPADKRQGADGVPAGLPFG